MEESELTYLTSDFWKIQMKQYFSEGYKWSMTWIIHQIHKWSNTCSQKGIYALMQRKVHVKQLNIMRAANCISLGFLESFAENTKYIASHSYQEEICLMSKLWLPIENLFNKKDFPEKLFMEGTRHIEKLPWLVFWTGQFHKKWNYLQQHLKPLLQFPQLLLSQWHCISFSANT